MTDEKNSEVLPEVERELQMGSRGTLRSREIPLIDLTDFSGKKRINYGSFMGCRS